MKEEMFANPEFIQQKAPEAESKTQDSSSTRITGKIGYHKSDGGYFICIGNPIGKFKIANQNRQLLEKYLRRGWEVNIEGIKGTNPLFIEKIDGQPYRGEGTSPRSKQFGIISRIVDRLR
jgi:hypothetical protein